LRQTQNGVAATVLNQCAFLRITNEEHSTNVVTRQISPHIEFARISRRWDNFRDSKQLQFIAKFRSASPTNLPHGARGLFPTFEFNRLEL
jgi:hypothetical protein